MPPYKVDTLMRTYKEFLLLLKLRSLNEMVQSWSSNVMGLEAFEWRALLPEGCFLVSTLPALACLTGTASAGELPETE
jgi:hypothetical protein